MKKIYVALCLVLLLIPGLVACGDSTSTATQSAATTVAATTAPATTSAATTAVPTTAPVTTNAATTVAATTAATAATTAAATTASAATTAATTSAGSSTTDLSYTDMTGYKGTLTKPAQKIICLWTDCFDILKELGMEPIAVDGAVYDILAASADVYPVVDKSKTVRRVAGSTAEPNIEDILSLQPDLVIGFGQLQKPMRDALATTGIPTYLINSPSYNDMINNLKTIGRLTGRTAQAEKAAEKFQSKLAAYKAKSPKNKEVMLINTSDGINFRVYTTKYLNCNLLNELANCTWTTGTQFKEIQPGIVNYTFEQLLAANPETILAYVYPGKPATPDLLKDSPLWKELKAVKNNQVYNVNAAIAQPGGTLGLGILLDTTMPLIYPDVFPKPLS